MQHQDNQSNTNPRSKTLKDIVNTPFKRAMFIVQLLSYVLIVGSPAIGGAIGAILEMPAKKIGLLILVIFIIGEVLFYASLFFLGKELILIVREKAGTWFKRKRDKKE